MDEGRPRSQSGPMWGAWLLALGGLLALVGFFVPWWVSPVSGGGLDVYSGPMFVYANFWQAASGAPSDFTASGLAPSVVILTVVPVLELAVIVTGLGLLRRGSGPRILGVLATGKVLAGTGAVLGIFFFVMAFLLGPDFAFFYPYTIPRPFVGEYLTLAGCVLVLMGLPVMHRERGQRHAEAMPRS